MGKRMLKALLAGLAVLGGLFALPAAPVEAVTNDEIAIVLDAEIPLSLDVSDPGNPVFKGSGEIMPWSFDYDSKRIVSAVLPEELVLSTPSGEKVAPEGSEVKITGSLTGKKGYHNYLMEYIDPSQRYKDEIIVTIPVTPELISYGLGEYSVSIPITFSSSVEYGSYSYRYDFTPWSDLVANGEVTVSSNKLTAVKRKDHLLDIDPSVTAIGSKAFNGASFYEVEVPSSVTSAANAFLGSNVEMVLFGKGTTTIPASICKGATSLQIAALGTDVRTIGNYAFEGCTSLYSAGAVTFVRTFGANCFKDCTSLKEFTLESGMTCNVSTEKSSPFYGAGLEKVTVSEGVTTIPSYMFCYCNNLSEVTLPTSLTSMGSRSFSNVPALAEITIRSNIARTSASTVVGCFENTGLKKITFEEGVTSVPRYMFADGCSNVTELNLADSITTINNGAFSGCTSLASLELPDSISVLGGDAFENATSLKEIHIKNNITLPRSCVVSPFEGAGLEKIVIEEGVTTVVSYLFNRACYNLTELSLPSTIRTLEGNAFGNATSLKTVTIPANVTISYGGVVSPFSGSGLEEIIFSEGVTTINSSLFRDGCSNVTSIVFPSTLTTIGYDAFEGCSSLTELNLPESVTSIGLGAFDNSTRLTSFTVNSTWSKPSGADMSPFAGGGLTDIYVRSGITALGAMHLANSSDTEMVIHIPTSVTSINTSTFLEGEKYSVVYDGTESQYAAIMKGEKFTPVSVICADTVLSTSLMSVDEDTDLDLDALINDLADAEDEKSTDVEVSDESGEPEAVDENQYNDGDTETDDGGDTETENEGDIGASENNDEGNAPAMPDDATEGGIDGSELAGEPTEPTDMPESSEPMSNETSISDDKNSITGEEATVIQAASDNLANAEQTIDTEDIGEVNTDG